MAATYSLFNSKYFLSCTEGSELSSRFDSYTFHAFAKRIIDRFRVVLTGNDALDVGYSIGSPRIARKQIEFEDLVPLAVYILQHSTIVKLVVV
jgi:hypothetical protein